MKRAYIVVVIVSAIVLGMYGKSVRNVVAPDRVFALDDEHILVANRAAKQLLLLASDNMREQGRLKFDGAVSDVALLPDGRAWVACEGNNGWLYELDMERFAVRGKHPSGATPSAVLYNSQSGSLWVAQRFGNELWEVDASSGEQKGVVKVGREPVDMISFDDDRLLLVANNLPEQPSNGDYVAAQLDVVDVAQRKVVSRIILPNGSTDVKSVAKDAEGEYAYVTHLLARYQLPTTQLDRGWMVTNALSIIDLKSKQLLNTVLLDTPQKGAANPWEVCVSGDSREIVVAAAGSQEVVIINRTALHRRLAAAQRGRRVTPSMGEWSNIPNDAGFLYGIREFIPTGGKGVRAVAVTDSKIFAANYHTAQISVIHRADPQHKPFNYTLGSSLAASEVGRGDMYFHDATLCYQTWQSCATCHPNDGRVDGLNWDLINDGMGNPKNSKSLILSHQTAPCMATGIRADAETAVRSGVKYILFAANVDEEVYTSIDAFLKAQRPIPSPYLENGRLSESAKRGEAIFKRECASCHSGRYYSDFKQYNVPWTTRADKGRKMDVTHLNECWRTAPYLYDGRCATMSDLLRVHGPREATSAEELHDLEQYLLSL